MCVFDFKLFSVKVGKKNNTLETGFTGNNTSERKSLAGLLTPVHHLLLLHKHLDSQVITQTRHICT